MDQCASALLAFPPQSDKQNNIFNTQNEAYHRAATVHTQRLGRLIKDRTKELVVHSTDLLSILDPAIHSLSYLSVLYGLVIPALSTNVPHEFILEKVVTALMKLDGRQCRYAGHILLDIMNAVASGKLLPPAVAVEVLSSALLKLDPSATMFTHLHLPLAAMAYQSGAIEPILPIIDSDIVFYPGMGTHETSQYLCDPTLPPPVYMSTSTGLTENVKDSTVLEYNLVCGLIYCSRRDWTKACAAFERVVTYPTKEGGCSQIMVDGFKKWNLVTLLSTGSPPAAMPHVTAPTIKTFYTLGKHYVDLATAFASDDVQQLKREAEEHAQLWLDDGNTTLVEEVLASYQKWRVLSLRDIYTKLSIPEIRRQTKSGETGQALATDEDVEALIQNMIIAGMLNGVIEKNDDGTKFLTFLPPSVQLSEHEFTQELNRTMGNIKGLGALLTATNRRLGTSKEYIKWAVKEDKRDKSGEAHDPTLPFESQHIDDEDLMGGIVTSG